MQTILHAWGRIVATFHAVNSNEDCRQANENVNDVSNHAFAKDGGNEVKVKCADESPVEAANYD